jgi:hypothetical protein
MSKERESLRPLTVSLNDCDARDRRIFEGAPVSLCLRDLNHRSNSTFTGWSTQVTIITCNDLKRGKH